MYISSLLLNLVARTPVRPGSEWEFWPFTTGFDSPWLPLLAKIVFLALILGLLALMLRLLFGPGGPMRPPEFDDPDHREPGDDRPVGTDTNTNRTDETPRSDSDDDAPRT